MTKFNLFKKLGNFNGHRSRIVDVKEFTKKYSPLKLGNGGSWLRPTCNKKFKVVSMKNSRQITCNWKTTDKEQELINKEFNLLPVDARKSVIKYVKIHGLQKDAESVNRPIRKDIITYYRSRPCCVCGSNSNTVVDHKNDLYNDPRVLNTKTQKLSDFQTLCTHCNLQKRQVCVKTRESGERYSAQKIPSLKVFEIDFIRGDFTFDTKDPEAMVGTYWHDPVAFMKFIKNNCVPSD